MSEEPISSKNAESILQQAIYMTQTAMELQDRYTSGEKYINYLKTIINGADKAVTALKLLSRSSLKLAENFVREQLLLKQTDSVRNDFTKLLSIIEKQIIESDDRNCDLIETSTSSNLSEKIKCLEQRQQIKQRESISFGQSNSSRSVNKIDIDEKYPEELSRESLIDLNNVANLPPVPEDIFTSFSSKPTRSSSLSSLKSMRKVKLFLQKAENSDEDDSYSDNDDYGKFYNGDSEDCKPLVSHSTPKKLLGNIKEESQD